MKKYLLLICLLFYNILYSQTNTEKMHFYAKLKNHIYSIKIPENFIYKVKKTNKEKRLEILTKNGDMIVIIDVYKVFSDKTIIELTNKDLNILLRVLKINPIKKVILEEEFKFKHFKKVKSSYVELTDKKTFEAKRKPNDYKYYTTGLISIENLFFSFKILSNKKGKEYKSIIKMFNESFFIQKDTFDYFLKKHGYKELN